MLVVLMFTGMGGRTLTMEAVRLWRLGHASCRQRRNLGARGLAVRIVSGYIAVATK